jgi:hypothetical protein
MSSACRLPAWAACLAVASFASLFTSPALALSGDDAAYDYLVQKICVDRTGAEVSVDPYFCPAGDSLRPLRPGEPMPYHRHDQPMVQGHDSFPVTMPDGHEVVVNPFDYAPFGQFDEDRDGYDLTTVREGWASIIGTRTKKGAATFFGAGCKPYNGWVLFPVSAFTGSNFQGGSVQMPIASVDWNVPGGTWPGPCPAHYITATWTTWEWLPGFKYGGVGREPTKTLDTIRSIHGFVDSEHFRDHGHLEAFYFTRLYGLTRWEGWATQSRFAASPELGNKASIADNACTGPTEMTYRGIVFERISCRDWSAITVPGRPERPPVWPVPGLN